MSRRIVWVQLIIGWLPIWALFTILIMSAHRIDAGPATIVAFRSVVAAALLGIGVHRLATNYPWPRPMRPSFVIAHMGYAFAYSVAWILLNSVIESVLHRAVVLSVGPSLHLSFVTGTWLYVMIAGVAYTSIATERTAKAEANAARAQLAALRAQLHPHFLFNALHTVVQLIPRDPARAAEAAELLAGLLRTTVEEDRDLVTLGEEGAFVERYLTLERMRFGDRLRVSVDIEEAARDCLVPVYAVQTLVENAVRHGAAPNVGATEVWVRGRLRGDRLEITVDDDGVGQTGALPDNGGTGLRRLRERLVALYGGAALLTTGTRAERGFATLLQLPADGDA